MTSTDDLIARLAQDQPPPPFNPGRIAMAAVAAILLPVAVFLLGAGHRSDLWQAWANPVVPVKTVLPLSIFLLSLAALLRLARPGARAGAAGRWLFAPAAVAVLLWLGTFALRAAPDRFAEVGLASVGECLGLILLLSVIPAVAIMRMLRRGASTRPWLSGGLVGLTAAAGAATGYSLFCTQDNPLFFLTWYGAAIGLVAGACAITGRRALRW